MRIAACIKALVLYFSNVKICQIYNCKNIFDRLLIFHDNKAFTDLRSMAIISLSLFSLLIELSGGGNAVVCLSSPKLSNFWQNLLVGALFHRKLSILSTAPTSPV